MVVWMVLALLALLLQESDKVFVDGGGTVTLAGRHTKLVEHSDASKRVVIVDLLVFKERLLAFGSYGGNTEVVEYDVMSDEWKVLKEMSGFIINPRVVGDRILMPDHVGSGPVHTFDGAEWGGLKIPAQLHTMDVAKYGGKLYVSTGGTSNRGKVLESADEGATWKEIRETKEAGRVLDMVEFKGKLWANERGAQLIAWDGKAWTEHPVKLPVKEKIDAKVGNAQLFVLGEKLLATQAELVYSFDGSKWSSAAPGCIDIWREGKTAYGLREDGSVHSSTDGAKWSAVTKEHAPAKDFDTNTGGARPYHRGAIAIHRGRLWVGGGEGRIHAGAVEEKGRWTSAPIERGPYQEAAVQWSCFAPEGTTAKIKVRSAEGREGLEGAPWVEAAGDRQAVAESHRFAQVRVEMTSDGKRSPAVRVAGFPKK
jgi:hypothetical protein